MFPLLLQSIISNQMRPRRLRGENEVSSAMEHNNSWPNAEDLQNGGTVLPVANLMADSESWILISYSRLIVIIALPRLISEIFACDAQTDGQTDNADRYYSCPPHSGGSAYNFEIGFMIHVIKI